MDKYEIVDKLFKYAFYIVFGAASILVAKEQYLRNRQNLLTPEQKLDIAEGKLDRLLGEVNANLKHCVEDVNAFKQQYKELYAKCGEANGRMDVMKNFFDKYSPEAFELEVRALKDKVDPAVIQHTLDETVRKIHESMRALKTEVYDNVTTDNTTQNKRLENITNLMKEVCESINLLNFRLKESGQITEYDVIEYEEKLKEPVNTHNWNFE